jgi:hypothetical protein
MADQIPDYAFTPLTICVDSVTTMGELLHLSIGGLSMLSNLPEVMKRAKEWHEVAGTPNTTTQSQIERITQNAAFADNERKNGYPLLHAFTLVGIWAALEAGIEDMLVGILCNEPARLSTFGFEKIKIPLSKYEQLDKEERMRFLLSEVQREHASGVGQGVNVFESVLYVFDLSGQVDSSIREGLWKLSNLRNVIVHRDSRADRRLVENCPSMSLKVGDRVIVGHELYGSLNLEVLRYVALLMRRLAVKYDAPLPKWVINWVDLVYPLAEKHE